MQTQPFDPDVTDHPTQIKTSSNHSKIDHTGDSKEGREDESNPNSSSNLNEFKRERETESDLIKRIINFGPSKFQNDLKSLLCAICIGYDVELGYIQGTYQGFLFLSFFLSLFLEPPRVVA